MRGEDQAEVAAPRGARAIAGLHGMHVIAPSPVRTAHVRSAVLVVASLVCVGAVQLLGLLTAGSPTALFLWLGWLAAGSFSIVLTVLALARREIDLLIEGNRVTWTHRMLGLRIGRRRRCVLARLGPVFDGPDKLRLYDADGTETVLELTADAAPWIRQHLARAARMTGPDEEPVPEALLDVLDRSVER